MSIRIGDRIVHITGTQVQSDWDEDDTTRPGYIRNKPDVATLGQDGKVLPEQLPELDYVPNDEKGAANGVATLDTNGLIPPAQIPEDAVQDRWWLLDGAEGGDVPSDYPIDLDEDVARWLFARLSEKIDVPLMGAANGVATLNEYGKVPPSQLPALDYVPNSEKAAANGVATLGNDGKVPSSQLPSLDYIPNSEKGTTVATLGNDGKVPTAQLPPLDYVPLTRTVNGKALSADISLTPSDIGSLATADTPVSLGVSMDPDTYVLTLQLKNSSNAVLDTKTVDLPLETMVVSASYSNGNLMLTLQSGQSITVDISDIVYGLVNSDELGTPGGVAQLDENGKVPPEQLPEMDYIPNDEKGAANGVATLDANSKVPVAELPLASTNSLGVSKFQSNNGLSTNYTGNVSVLVATNAHIDDRLSYAVRAITPGNIEYAVRSVLPNITVIPADTTSYVLKDASATTNSHSCTYVHTPSAASTYVFPAVTTTNVVHAITLIIDFSTVQTYAFEDSEGTALLPLFTPSISQGDVYAFKCEYSVVQSKWLIYPVKEGGVGDDYVMQSQVGAAGGVAGLDSNGLVPSAKLPLATQSTLGAVKVLPAYGTNQFNNYVRVERATTNEIDAREQQFKPITPDKLNYAVTAALTDAKKISLTDSQKASAQDTLGVGPAPLILSAAPTTSTVGVPGQLAVNTATSKTYHCTAKTNTGTEAEPVWSYTWTDDINAMGGYFHPGNTSLRTTLSMSNAFGFAIGRGVACVGGGSHDLVGGSFSVGANNRTSANYSVCIGRSLRTARMGQLVIGDGTYSASKDLILASVNVTANALLEFGCEGNLMVSGGIQQKVFEIPAETSTYTLRCGVQFHSPSMPTTYTLPLTTRILVRTDDYSVDYFVRKPELDGAGYYAWQIPTMTTYRYTASATPSVGDNTYTNTALTSGAKAITAIDNRTHDIILLVSFANTQSIAFEDSQGNTIAPLDTLDIVQGDVVEYICSWDWLQNTWVISASHRKPKPAPPLPTYTDGDALEY